MKSDATLHKRVYFYPYGRTGLKSSATLGVSKPLSGQSRTGLQSKSQFWTLAPLSGKTRTGLHSDGADMRSIEYKNEPIRHDKSTPVFVYDQNERMQFILSDDTVPYTGEIPEVLNGTKTIELDVVATDKRVAKIVNEGRLVTQDADGDFVEFIIRTIEDGEPGMKRVEGEGSEYELIDDWLESYVQPSVDLKTALSAILEGTRWSVCDVESTQMRSIELKHMSKRRAVNELIELFNVEVKYTVETRGNRVVNRKINLYQSRGQDIGRRFEAGKDIISSKRVYDSTDIKTALYGVGVADESGKRLTFADVVWSKELGDPVDKPLGQPWVGDPKALVKWGRMGGRQHKFDGYDGQEEDPAELLLNTWNALQEQNKLRDTYEVEVVNLGEILDYPHEKVRLGDKVLAINHEMVPVLESQAHIIEYRHNLNDRRLSTCVLGHFRARVNTDRTVADLEKDWNDKRGEVLKKPDKVKEELQGEMAREIAGTLAEAQKRIDAAKLELEESMKNIEIGKDKIVGLDQDLQNLDYAIKNKLPIGMAAADVNSGNTKILGKNLVIDGNATVTGIIGAYGAVFNDLGTNNMVAKNATIENATLTGIFDAPYARIQRASLENVTITGSLTGVSGTFVGDVVGGRIRSGSSIDVSTDVYVGDNIVLGMNSRYGKSIKFGGYGGIRAFDDFSIQLSDSVYVAGGQLTGFYIEPIPEGTRLSFKQDYASKIDGRLLVDYLDRKRVKIGVPGGAEIWMDPNGNFYFLYNNVVIKTLYSNGMFS